jgi:hypothetical protein
MLHLRAVVPRKKTVMGSFVDFAEMKAHCSVEHGLLEDSLRLSGSQIRVEELAWAVMRWTGWHVSFVPSAEVTAFIHHAIDRRSLGVTVMPASLRQS